MYIEFWHGTGTITPCWSYDDHHELWSRKHGTTGFNTQLICLLDGYAIYVSDPLPGCTHDAKAFTTTPVAPSSCWAISRYKHGCGGRVDLWCGGQAAVAVPVTSFQVANRMVISRRYSLALSW